MEAKIGQFYERSLKEMTCQPITGPCASLNSGKEGGVGHAQIQLTSLDGARLGGLTKDGLSQDGSSLDA
jgi:hypothetical protein